MSHDLYTYSSQDPIYFKLTLNGVGVSPTLGSWDVMLSQDANPTTLDITAEVLPVSGTNVTGVHKWTPGSETRTQCQVMVINIKDYDGGASPDFDENCLIISTGGHASARFSG